MRIEARVEQARAPHALGRALAATIVAVTSATAAHSWAGGQVPTGPGLVLVTAVVLAGGLLVLARDVPAWAVLPAVAVAQLGLHESFGLVAGHEHHSAAATESRWTWQMVLAHLFVTLATALLWWLGRRAASFVVSVRVRPALPVVVRQARPRPEGPVRPSVVHFLVSPRRGPPLAVRPT